MLLHLSALRAVVAARSAHVPPLLRVVPTAHVAAAPTG